MRGGTMLGLILGLVIGLAVALAVALYIAKVPIPFVNQASVQSDGQDATETAKNLNWNPNASLQARGPALSASNAGSAVGNAAPSAAGTGYANPAGTPQQLPAVPPPVEVVPPGGESADNNAPAPATHPATASNSVNNALQLPAQERAGQSQNHGRPSSQDRLGEFAAARARAVGNAGANADQVTATPFTYFVQTGAFTTSPDADAQRARLSLLGMEAAISQRDQAGRPVYRVRVGPFQNKTAADQIKQRLTSNGFDAALVRVQR
jgi:cell division protein FtsN